jgi:hypothetical protein
MDKKNPVSGTDKGYAVRHHKMTKWAFYPCEKYNVLNREGVPKTYAFETLS